MILSPQMFPTLPFYFKQINKTKKNKGNLKAENKMNHQIKFEFLLLRNEKSKF